MTLKVKLEAKRYNLYYAVSYGGRGMPFRAVPSLHKLDIAKGTLQKVIRALEKESAAKHGYVRDNTDTNNTAIYSYYCNGLLNEIQVTVEAIEPAPVPVLVGENTEGLESNA